MSKVGGTFGFHEFWSYLLYIHYEYIRHRLLVFNIFFMTTSNFGGGSAPLLSNSGGLKPALPPRFSGIFEEYVPRGEFGSHITCPP